MRIPRTTARPRRGNRADWVLRFSSDGVHACVHDHYAAVPAAARLADDRRGARLVVKRTGTGKQPGSDDPYVALCEVAFGV